MKNIAVISSYRYDISYIDDNRAWVPLMRCSALTIIQ